MGISANSLFAWQGLTLVQAEDVFKIGTDALLLGTWCPKVVQPARRVLDAGTGTGVLALAMAMAFPAAQVTGMDVSAKSVALAKANAGANNLGARCLFREEDIRMPVAGQPEPFDLVISNPPYFGHHVPSARLHDALARHRAFGPGEWLEGCFRRISPVGQVCLVIPSVDAFAWIREANWLGGYVRNRLEVRVFRTDPLPFRTLLQLSRALVKPATDRLVMQLDTGAWHPDFIEWRGYE